jgi:predicted RNase H-like nuclease (RuvC/YqgF family)
MDNAAVIIAGASIAGNIVQAIFSLRKSNRESDKLAAEAEKIRHEIEVGLLEQSFKLREEMRKQYEHQKEALKAENKELREEVFMLQRTVEDMARKLEDGCRDNQRLNRKIVELQEELKSWKLDNSQRMKSSS